MMDDIKEISNLKLVIDMLPYIEHPKDLTDKRSSMIRLYCEDAVKKIESLQNELYELTLVNAVDFKNQVDFLFKLNNMAIDASELINNYIKNSMNERVGDE